MENGVEAIKMVFGILIFVLAISISISCFSSATQAIQRIVEIQQAEESYVTDANGKYLNYVDFEIGKGTREVGIETIVPTMYKAYKEDFAIYFYKADGTEFVLYEENGKKINYIDLQKESHGNAKRAMEFLEVMLENRLYDELSKHTFIEHLGEYYHDDVSGTTETAEVNKNKKRVIAYIQK